MDTHEPKTGTTAEVIDGRISMVCDGRTVSHAAYCDYIMRGDWEARNREFIDSGTRVFHLTCPHGGPDYFTNGFWTDVGVYPDRTEPAVYPWTLDRQVANLLAMAPDARFLLKFTVSAPLGFTQKRADHMQTDEDGQRYREPTLASAEFLDGLGHFVRHVVHHCETRPWGNRMLGYLALPYGEGVMPLCIAGKMFDCSPVNDAAFQAWVAARYPTDAALQEAWHDPAARRETVRVPRDREWFERRRTAAATFGGQPLGAGAMASNSGSFPAGLFHWIEPGNAGREIDYCHFMRENFVRWVRTIVGGIKAECAALGVQRLAGLDITKQPLTGWQIRSAFDGIGDGQSAPNILHLSGSWGVGELLDDPDLDAIWTPADYHARTLGFAYEAEGVTDSLVLRNKVMMVENDARCYVGEGIRDQGAFLDDT